MFFGASDEPALGGASQRFRPKMQRSRSQQLLCTLRLAQKRSDPVRPAPVTCKSGGPGKSREPPDRRAEEGSPAREFNIAELARKVVSPRQHWEEN